MRKRIAVLMVLMMILGTACALAEKEEEIEDLTGGWVLLAGGKPQLYVNLERDGSFLGVPGEDAPAADDEDFLTEGTWTYDGTVLTLTAKGETLTFTYTLPEGCETGGVFAGVKDGIPISFEEYDVYEEFDVYRKTLWKTAEDPTITPERQALFDAGMKTVAPPFLEPVVYLASWGEAGTGHAFLCREIPEEPDDKMEWMIIFIYEDPVTGDIEVWDSPILDLGDYCYFSSDG